MSPDEESRVAPSSVPGGHANAGRVHACSCMLTLNYQQPFPVVERDGLLERYIYFLIFLMAASLVLVDAIMRIIQHKRTDSGFSFRKGACM